MVALNVLGIENGEALLLAHLDLAATPFDPRGRSWLYPKSDGWHTKGPGGIEASLQSFVTRAVTVTDVATDDDFAILADASGGAGDVDLLTAVNRHGKLLAVKKIDATTNVITIDPAGAELIDGVASKTLVYEDEMIVFISDNVGWQVLWQTPTLQNVYDRSTSAPQIVVTAGNGGLDIRDAATPIAASLLRVANNAASTIFFDVTAVGTRIEGTFEHVGTLWGIHGATPVAQSSAYAVTNVTPDRGYDANATTLNEMADVLGTVIADLKLKGILG